MSDFEVHPIGTQKAIDKLSLTVALQYSNPIAARVLIETGCIENNPWLKAKIEQIKKEAFKP
jgi:hypothetical protein